VACARSTACATNWRNCARAGDGYPSEVQPVVDELNAVLARNAEFVERARNQAGNKPGTCGEDAAERDG